MGLDSGSRLGPYEILALLGAGGMGDVYAAHDTSLDRDVAIKVLTPSLSSDASALARFEREAKAIAALSHPAILAIHEFATRDGTAYVETEPLSGETLRHRLAAGALSVRTAIDYDAQVADGLAAAHDKGFVHRDVKPENLFVTAEGRAKINSLSRLPALKVLARSTVFRYKGTNDPIRAARELRVRALLTGNIMLHGNTLIIQADLVDVASGAQLWGEQYNRSSIRCRRCRGPTSL